MSERTKITIDLNIKTKTLRVLKKLYATQEEMGTISKHHTALNDVAKMMVDGILTDVRLEVKDAIKKAIILQDEASICSWCKTVLKPYWKYCPMCGVK